MTRAAARFHACHDATELSKGTLVCCLTAHILNHTVLSGFGAAYGTAKSGVGIASMGVMRPELVMKSIVPVVMAGVLGIYGLIIAVIISTGSTLPCSLFRCLRGRLHCVQPVAPERSGPAPEAVRCTVQIRNSCVHLILQ